MEVRRTILHVSHRDATLHLTCQELKTLIVKIVIRDLSKLSTSVEDFDGSVMQKWYGVS